MGQIRFRYYQTETLLHGQGNQPRERTEFVLLKRDKMRDCPTFASIAPD